MGNEKNCRETEGTQSHGSTVQYAFSHPMFNLHQEFLKVKWESSIFANIWRDPLLTAGPSGNFPTFCTFDDDLFTFQQGSFRLYPWETLSIDKLCILFPCPRRSSSEAAKKFWKYFDKVLYAGHARQMLSTALYNHCAKWGYEYYLQWDTVNIDSPTIRLEFNPNHADLSLLPVLFSALGEKAFSFGRVSRIDIAVDYTMDIHPVGWSCQGVRCKDYYYWDNKVSSIYFGARDSDNKIRVYNKALEQKQKFDVELPCPFWRVESELRRVDKDDISLVNGISSAFNPFQNLKHYDLFGFQPDGEGAFSSMVRLARYDGVDSALHDYDYKTRKRYREMLDLRTKHLLFNEPSTIYSNCFSEVYRVLISRIWDYFLEGQKEKGHCLYREI